MTLISETVRYLGYGKSTPDERTMGVIKSCIDELHQIAEPKNVFRRYPITIEDECIIKSAGLTMHSKSLCKNLKNCSEVIFFAATLGIPVDRLLNKYIKLNISKAAVLQAAAAAFLEEYSNHCQKSLEKSLNKEGLFLRPRFSPGYGDFSLEYQSDFLNVLNAYKTIGLVLTEGNIMIPEKSISAVIGISSENSRCHTEGCELCAKKDCIYSRLDCKNGDEL